MKKTLVHGVQITTPATFVEMSDDEMKQAFNDNNSHRWGARDVRHHRMFVITWQDSNALLAKLVSTKALIKRIEKISSKGYAGHDYQAGSFFQKSVCGLEAEGYEFTYKVQGIPQHMQNIVFKHGKTCYTIYWVDRPGPGKASDKALESILDSMELAE